VGFGYPIKRLPETDGAKIPADILGKYFVAPTAKKIFSSHRQHFYFLSFLFRIKPMGIVAIAEGI
jgi:hypothetical protein